MFFRPGNGSPSATNVVVVVVVVVVVGMLSVFKSTKAKLRRFTTDRRQTSHTHR